jgi:hypothetical protein
MQRNAWLATSLVTALVGVVVARHLSIERSIGLRRAKAAEFSQVASALEAGSISLADVLERLGPPEHVSIRTSPQVQQLTPSPRTAEPVDTMVLRFEYRPAVFLAAKDEAMLEISLQPVGTRLVVRGTWANQSFR